MTREKFITALRAELLAHYAWTADRDKLDRFMDSVRATLRGDSSWCADGAAARTAWRVIGGRGRVSLKALRALP